MCWNELCPPFALFCSNLTQKFTKTCFRMYLTIQLIRKPHEKITLGDHSFQNRGGGGFQRCMIMITDPIDILCGFPLHVLSFYEMACCLFCSLWVTGSPVLGDQARTLETRYPKFVFLKWTIHFSSFKILLSHPKTYLLGSISFYW